MTDDYLLRARINDELASERATSSSESLPESMNVSQSSEVVQTQSTDTNGSGAVPSPGMLVSDSNSSSTALKAAAASFSVKGVTRAAAQQIPTLSIPELLYKSDNPAVWAMGLAVIQNWISEETLEADMEALEFTKKTAKASRQQTMDSNYILVEKLEKLIKEQSVAFRAGTNEGGMIRPKDKPKPKLKWWQKLLMALFVVITSLFVPGAITYWIVAGIALGIAAAVLQAIAKGMELKGKSSKFLDWALMLANDLQPLNLVLDATFDTIKEAAKALGANEKQLEIIDKVKKYVSMAANIIAAVVLSVVIAVASAVTGGAALALLMAVVGIIEGALQMANGIFDILLGVKKLKAAKIQKEIDQIQTVISSSRAFTKMVQDEIDNIIAHMQSILQDMNSNWTNASEMLKTLKEADVTIAYSIGI